MDKKSILIVEDERIVAEDIKRTILKFGYKVTAIVPSGERVFEELEKYIPDLILMDINLKGDLNGMQVADIVKKKHSIPIVYLTANADEKTMQNAKITEPFGYILKPFEERELHAIIEMAFYRFKIEKELRESREKIIHLHATAREIAASSKEQEVYRLAIQAAEEILDFSMCTLDIVEGDKMVLKATSSENLIKNETEFFISEDLMNKTIKGGKTLLFDDFQKELYFCQDKHLHSLISAPIGDLGVFQVASHYRNVYTDDDVKMLDLLLGHTTEALKRIKLQNKLEELAIHDSLTGTYNRHYMQQALEREFKQSKRYHRSIGFLMIDINKLKHVNDKYGHQMGDTVIKAVGDFLKIEARETDIIIRYGGDEFLIMLPETGEEVETMRERLLDHMHVWNETNDIVPFPITFSVGASYWNVDSETTIKEIIAIADAKMYEDKRSKRN